MILEQAAISYSRGSSRPRDGIRVFCTSCIGRQIVYHCATQKAYPGGDGSSINAVCETERSASPSKGSNGGTVGLTWAQVSPGGATIEQRLGYCPGYGEADGAGNIGERRRERPAGGAGAAGGNGWAN